MRTGVRPLAEVIFRSAVRTVPGVSPLVSTERVTGTFAPVGRFPAAGVAVSQAASSDTVNAVPRPGFVRSRLLDRCWFAGRTTSTAGVDAVTLPVRRDCVTDVTSAAFTSTVAVAGSYCGAARETAREPDGLWTT